MTRRSTIRSLIRPLACAVSLAALSPAHALQVVGGEIGQVIGSTTSSNSSNTRSTKPGQPGVSSPQPSTGAKAPAKPHAPSTTNSGQGSSGPAAGGR